MSEKCGTYAGRMHHTSRGTEVCDPCRDAYNAYQRKWRAANPERYAKYEAKRPPGRSMLRPLDARRNDHLQARYGITLAQRDEIWEWQDRRCLCCETQETHGREKPWQVDHDHDTGVIRGIVCTRCNRLIAQCGDTAESVAVTLTTLLAYLRASGDQLPPEILEQVIDVLRAGVALRSEGRADADRVPIGRRGSGIV